MGRNRRKIGLECQFEHAAAISLCSSRYTLQADLPVVIPQQVSRKFSMPEECNG